MTVAGYPRSGNVLLVLKSSVRGCEVSGFGAHDQVGISLAVDEKTVRMFPAELPGKGQYEMSQSALP